MYQQKKAPFRIKAKYNETISTASIIKQYKYNVPEQWIEQGYVEQIKEPEQRQ